MQRADLKSEEWEDALWDFLLEHCEIEASGAMFVKFHCSGRADIVRRIRNRHEKVQAYHREDPRKKEYRILKMAGEHHEDRKAKRDEWIAKRNERRRQREIEAMPWAKRTLQEIKEAIHRRLLRTHGRAVQLRQEH